MFGLFRAAVGNAFVLLALALLAIWLLGPALLWALRIVLETLNNL